jgi:hypothetical protein
LTVPWAQGGLQWALAGLGGSSRIQGGRAEQALWGRPGGGGEPAAGHGRSSNTAST